MSMSEIEISTPKPANIIRQKLAVSSEVFLSLVCKKSGYLYIVLVAINQDVVYCLSNVADMKHKCIQSPY